MAFIELTKYDDNNLPASINTDDVIAVTKEDFIARAGSGKRLKYTYISLTSAGISVQEPYEKVMRKIKEAQEPEKPNVLTNRYDWCYDEAISIIMQFAMNARSNTNNITKQTFDKLIEDICITIQKKKMNARLRHE